MKPSVTARRATARLEEKTISVALGAVVAMSGIGAALAEPAAKTGPSTPVAPYLVGTQPGVVATPIITTGEAVNGYKMAGIPDGLGAYDNGDGTFTVLVNHEIPGDAGVPRAHNAPGGKGAFVSKWTIDKETLRVLAGEDLIKRVYRWNSATRAWEKLTTNFSRFCSADLPEVSAFFDAGSGKGTKARIFMNGEETGPEGRAIATVVTGPEAGNGYELPWLGRFSWENSVAKPGFGVQTVVTGLDDSAGGQVYFYIGTKQSSGNEIEKAGLANGELWGLKIQDVATENDATGGVGFSKPFTLVKLGDVSSKTGAELEAASNAAGVSRLNRPEDGSWDPTKPANFYFATTASFGSATSPGISRMWQLTFDDPTDIAKGGTATVVVASPPYDARTPDADQAGPRMMDNLTVGERGQVIVVEDVGNNAYIGGVWQYDPSTKALARIARHDPAMFGAGTPPTPSFITQDEEASGVIPAPFLGEGRYLIDVQSHKASGDPTTVEGGQLLLLQVPPVKPVR
jgi:hypothetical protein